MMKFADKIGQCDIALYLLVYYTDRLRPAWYYQNFL